MIPSTPRDADLFRALTPRWAYLPLSGAGAASAGGRFNRYGIDALYLSLASATAIAEYQQSAVRLPPLTLCEYRATLPALVDLRRLNEGTWDPLWQDWATDWRASLCDLKLEPSTWAMGDLAIAAGYGGIIFPSLAHPSGVNVVLFLDAFEAAGGGISVHDPDGLLPSNNRSWSP